MSDRPSIDTQTYGIIGGLIAAVWGFIKFKKAPRQHSQNTQIILERLTELENRQREQNRKLADMALDVAETRGELNALRMSLPRRRGLYYNPPSEPREGTE